MAIQKNTYKDRKNIPIALYLVFHNYNKHLLAIDGNAANVLKHIEERNWAQEDVDVTTTPINFPIVLFKFGKTYTVYSKNKFREYLAELVKGENFTGDMDKNYGTVYVIKKPFYAESLKNEMASLQPIELTYSYIKEIFQIETKKKK